MTNSIVETLDGLPIWENGEISKPLLLALYNRMQQGAAQALFHERKAYEQRDIHRNENARLESFLRDIDLAVQIGDKQTALDVLQQWKDGARIGSSAEPNGDSARLEWVMRNVSGSEWRRLGVLYGDFAGIRDAIDIARELP